MDASILINTAEKNKMGMGKIQYIYSQFSTLPVYPYFQIIIIIAGIS